jgi:hypothetical protein
MPNFLEQLVAEWYEFRGYFVRRNIKVGRRAKGGFDSELDVVAFHPEHRHLVHVEPSMDAYAWNKREKRFAAKFAAGKKFIPSLFVGLTLPQPEQIALLVFAGGDHPPHLDRRRQGDAHLGFDERNPLGRAMGAGGA